MLDAGLDDFRIGVPVQSRDGKQVGKLHRLVLDRETFRLRALVVEESLAFAGKLLAPGALMLVNDVVVPPEAVAEVNREGLRLALSAAEVRRLPPYLRHRHAQAGPAAGEAGVGGALLASLEALGGAATIPADVEEVASKSEGEIEIDPGEKVSGRGGHKLGEVEEVLISEGELVGVVLKQGGWFGKRVLLPRRFLSRGSDLELEAGLSLEDLEELEPFVPAG